MSTYMQGGLQEFLIGVTNVEFMGFGALGLQSLRDCGFEGLMAFSLEGFWACVLEDLWD